MMDGGRVNKEEAKENQKKKASRKKRMIEMRKQEKIRKARRKKRMIEINERKIMRMTKREIMTIKKCKMMRIRK